MFTQHQVAEFKEAFQFIDQDKDGFLSKNDIRATFDSLGRICTDSELEGMIKEASGPINFTMFLTIFGDRTQGTDEEDVILNAFAQFDEGDGLCKEETYVYLFIHLDLCQFTNKFFMLSSPFTSHTHTHTCRLRHSLVTWGEKFSASEVNTKKENLSN